MNGIITSIRPRLALRALTLVAVLALPRAATAQDPVSAEEIAALISEVDPEQCVWPETRGYKLIYAHVRDDVELVVVEYRPQFGDMPSVQVARHRYAGGIEIYYHGLQGHAPFGPGPEVRSTYVWQGSDFIKTVHLDEEQTAALIALGERVVAGCPPP